MKFRPCIDLHNGKVKQIVGSTLSDVKKNDRDNNNENTENHLSLKENFVTDQPASEYATMYLRDGLTGGHVIQLGGGNVEVAKAALKAYPGGLQIGGGITNENAMEWLNAGASHVIVTSHVFHNGTIDYQRLHTLVQLVGKERLVLDLSCRRRQKENQEDGTNNDRTTTTMAKDPYFVVTDRWQTYTTVEVNPTTLQELSQYCDEFLIHGVDVEGKQCGILEDLVELLGLHSPIPVTYAGGVRSLQDMELVNRLGRSKVDLTIGSALDCFGGTLKYDDVVAYHNQLNPILK